MRKHPPLDDRRLDALVTILCTAIAGALVAREIVGHLQAARRRRRWTLAPSALRASIGVDAVYVGLAIAAFLRGGDVKSGTIEMARPRFLAVQELTEKVK